MERVQLNYIKWFLGLDRTTPSYLVLNEANRSKIAIKAAGRASKYEEKIRKGVEGGIRRECWLELEKGKADKRERVE